MPSCIPDAILVPLQPPLAKTLRNRVPGSLISSGRVTTYALACDAGETPTLTISWLRVCPLMVKGLRLCSGGALSHPWVGWLTRPQCVYVGLPSLWRINPENFAANTLLSLGSCRGVSVAQSLGACIGCTLWRREGCAGSAGWSLLRGAHSGAPLASAEHRHLGKTPCCWQQAFLRRRDHFLSSDWVKILDVLFPFFQTEAAAALHVKYCKWIIKTLLHM